MKLGVTIIATVALALAGGFAIAYSDWGLVSYSSVATSPEGPDIAASSTAEEAAQPEPGWPRTLDKEAYDEALLELADYTPPEPQIVTVPATANSATTTRTVTPPSPLRYSSSTNVTVEGERWPPEVPYPHGGAILPFKRILAYYGNFYSRRMGILGELDPPRMLAKLASTTKLWEEADPDTPVLPAIQYIASVAQADAGVDGMYRNVMPAAEIEKAYELAQEIDGILILDIQVGLSPIERELPKFREYLTRPDVHFAIDPEFSMKSGRAPGTVIGTYDARDINYVIDYMADIVNEYELPPKVLVVHRFTQDMVTNYDDIKPRPEVQVVMDMDGWGSKQLKRNTYRRVIEPEPVQFTGVKIFYKNDLKPPSTGLFTPQEVLELTPEPIYIQYQ